MSDITMNKCASCPRACGTDRTERAGFCGVRNGYLIARIGLHLWEEPCISHGAGSGTVFFGGCPLHCVFCQNHEISEGKKGRYISEDELTEHILCLCEKGAVNINLVSPTQYSERLPHLLEKLKTEVNVPIVYNTGGYERIESLRRLEGLVDVYLPDMKYFSSELSRKYSGVGDYFDVAAAALEEMIRQTGYGELTPDGIMERGTLVRHLILPSHKDDSKRILDELAARFDPSRLFISLMRQYFPTYKASEHPEINRKLTTLEYGNVLKHAQSLGFAKGFTQGKGSATEEFVPEFDF